MKTVKSIKKVGPAFQDDPKPTPTPKSTQKINSVSGVPDKLLFCWN